MSATVWLWGTCFTATVWGVLCILFWEEIYGALKQPRSYDDSNVWGIVIVGGLFGSAVFPVTYFVVAITLLTLYMKRKFKSNMVSLFETIFGKEEDETKSHRE